MPVETPHPKYKAVVGFWQMARMAASGEAAVKAAREEVLPKLADQAPADYNAYLARATYFNATGRTVAGLVGAIVRKEPKVEVPAAERDRLQHIGRRGETQAQILKRWNGEVVKVGRVGHLVDAEEGDDTANPNPYIVRYLAENVTNWRERVINDRKVPVMVVLRETVSQTDPEDQFKSEPVTRFRVLKLGIAPAMVLDEGIPVGLKEGFDESDVEEPFYFQEIWIENPEKSAKPKFIFDRFIVPRMAGGKLQREIPFEFTNTEDNETDPQEPPLLDLATINLSHFRNSADLEHGTHFTALPTPWVAGGEKLAGKVLRLGAMVAWILPLGATAGFLEYTGAGLGSIRELMNEKKKEMAVQGARLLEEKVKGVEAAETVRLRHAGESSILASISSQVSLSYERLLRILLAWAGSTEKPENITVQQNRDFGILGTDPGVMAQMFAALQSGAISFRSWIHFLQTGEPLPDGVTVEDEANEIELGLPGQDNDNADEKDEKLRTGMTNGHDHPITDDGSIGPGGDNKHTHEDGDDERTGVASDGTDHIHTKPAKSGASTQGEAAAA